MKLKLGKAISYIHELESQLGKGLTHEEKKEIKQGKYYSDLKKQLHKSHETIKLLKKDNEK